MRAGATLALAALALVSLSGCRAAQEQSLRRRSLESQLFAARPTVPLAQLEARLLALRPQLGPCGPCLLRLQVLPDRSRVFCLTDFEREQVCLSARVEGERLVLAPAPGQGALSLGAVRSVWNLVDAPGAQQAQSQLEAALPGLLDAQAEAFEPRLSAFATARTAVVVSGDRASFGFGGQAGARLWATNLLLLGAGVDLESVVAPRLAAFFVLGPTLRAELAVWDDDAATPLRAPASSFVMSVVPLIALTPGREAGVRATVGLQLVHVSRWWTPLLFEVGFQSLVVGGSNVSGFRTSLGLGF